MPIDKTLKQQLKKILEDFSKDYEGGMGCWFDKLLNEKERDVKMDCISMRFIISTEEFAGKKLTTVTELRDALEKFCKEELTNHITCRRSYVFWGDYRKHTLEDITQNGLYKAVMEVLDGKYGYFPEALTRELEQQSRENKQRERDIEIEIKRLTEENSQLQSKIDALLAGKLDTETAAAIDRSQLLTREIRALREIALQRQLAEKTHTIYALEKEIRDLEAAITLREKIVREQKRDIDRIVAQTDHVIAIELPAAEADLLEQQRILLEETRRNSEERIVTLEQEVRELEVELEKTRSKKQQHHKATKVATRTGPYSAASHATTFKQQQTQTGADTVPALPHVPVAAQPTDKLRQFEQHHRL